MRLLAALLLGSLGAFVLALLALLEANQATDSAALGRLRAAFGPGGSWPGQYLRWMGGALVGNFGVSWRGGGAVGPELAQPLTVSLALGGAALLLASALAMPLSRHHAAARPRGATDRGIDAVALLTQSIPNF